MVKKVYRKKRAIKKRGYKKMRITRNLAPKNVHYFKRHCDFGTITKASGTASYFKGYNFSLSDLPGYTEFTSLFDFYKICAIKFVVIPCINTANIQMDTPTVNQASANLGFMRILSVIDYNDSSNPTNFNELREYATCRVTPFLKGHRRYFKPATKSSDDYMFRNRWISTDSTAEDYYGLKLAIDFNNTNFATSTEVAKIECVFYLKCKAIK